MHLTRRIVSAGVRLHIRETYPSLDSDPAYWALFEYLLFGRFSDEATDQTVIPHELLAAIEGKHHQIASKNYTARALLDRFSEDVLPIRYTGWSYIRGKARMVEEMSLVPSVRV